MLKPHQTSCWKPVGDSRDVPLAFWCLMPDELNDIFVRCWCCCPAAPSPHQKSWMRLRRILASPKCFSLMLFFFVVVVVAKTQKLLLSHTGGFLHRETKMITRPWQLRMNNEFLKMIILFLLFYLFCWCCHNAWCWWLAVVGESDLKLLLFSTFCFFFLPYAHSYTSEGNMAFYHTSLFWAGMNSYLVYLFFIKKQIHILCWDFAFDLLQAWLQVLCLFNS